MQTYPLRLVSQAFDVATHWVVALVAMHIHAQTALCRQLAEPAYALCAVGHRALEVRNAAHYVHAHV